jgi:hypothetical protein
LQSDRSLPDTSAFSRNVGNDLSDYAASHFNLHGLLTVITDHWLSANPFPNNRASYRNVDMVSLEQRSDLLRRQKASLRGRFG